MIGCEKPSELPFSKIPHISLVGLSHDTLIEYRDVLSITIFYQDGDGDLGFEDPETYAVFIRDSRLETFDGFYLGPVAPPGVAISIQGNLTIEFPSLFVFGNRGEESTRFFIYIVDRAGNKSNELITQPVIIKKP
jgi:hypothetical protein